MALGFNGAATFRLRKVLEGGGAQGVLRRFNGAATFRLRKVTSSGTKANWPQWASMGPQPFGCGRNVPRLSKIAKPMLQWGRNLSVAEGWT